LLDATEPERLDNARKRADEAVGIHLSHPWWKPFALVASMVVSYALGDHPAARSEAPPRLEDSIRLDWPPFSIACLAVIAMLLADDGEYARAAELLGLALNHPASPSGWLDNWPLLTRRREQLQAELGMDAYHAAWARGKHRSLDEAVRPFIESQTTNTVQSLAPSIELLTERELEILRLIVDGLSNREIAEHLVLAVSTVKWHVNQIFGKLYAANRVQAIARARELKLLG
jgi:DNA-binding CsgD family transcriptional regulator